jgi:hypothetical protein
LNLRSGSNHQHRPSVILTEQMDSFLRGMANMHRCEPQLPSLLSLVAYVQNLLTKNPEPVLYHVNPQCSKQYPES